MSSHQFIHQSSDPQKATHTEDSIMGISVVATLLGNRRNHGAAEALKSLKNIEAAYRSDLKRSTRKRGITLLPPRKVTIYSDEELKDAAALEIPLQVKYTGKSPVIPSFLADTPCAALGVEGMLWHLNEVMRTTYTIDQPGLAPLLQTFIDLGFDFGLAFGHLRAHWYQDLANLQRRLGEREAQDKEMRASAVDESGLFVRKFMPPRRAWDLCSNRVLPWWAFQCDEDAGAEDEDEDEDEDDSADDEDEEDEQAEHDEDTEDDQDDQDDGGDFEDDQSDDEEEEDEDDEDGKGFGPMSFEYSDEEDDPSLHFQVNGSCFGLSKPTAISHSWLAQNLRHSVSTPINSHAWPVPIPIDITLDRVRIELLNLGTDIAWLDVLCLRQEGVPELEALRIEEWKTDVPAIGGMYLLNNQDDASSSLVTYFNGLGRPFRIDETKMEDDHHYLNRAWTFQEFDDFGTIGGLTPRSPFVRSLDEITLAIDQHSQIKRFYAGLQRAASSSSFVHRQRSVFSVLAAMGPRCATHAVDLVGAVATLLADTHVPVYIRHEGPSAAENAWALLIQAMPKYRAGDLFSLFPAAGDGVYAWAPSWQQATQYCYALATKTPPEEDIFCIQQDRTGRFQYECNMVTGMVQGLAEPDPRSECRSGTLTIACGDATHTFNVTAHHQLPIPESWYTLVGNVRSERDYRLFPLTSVCWVVGRPTPSGDFRKMTVLKMHMSEGNRLAQLQVAERKVVSLA